MLTNTIKSVKDKEKDKKTKGYLYQIQAEYTNKIDPALSQEVLKAGKKIKCSYSVAYCGNTISKNN